MSIIDAAVAKQRIRCKIDQDWKFLRDDAAGAQATNFDDKAWRPVDLPHDYSIEDLPPGRTFENQLHIDGSGWTIRSGDDPTWSSIDVDDNKWEPVSGRALTGMPEHSYAWFRKRILIPDTLQGKDILLVIGMVDDTDETYVNGVKVGATGTMPPNYSSAWNTVRRYPIPASLLKGDGSDIIAVRAYNGEGGGGIVPSYEVPGLRNGPFDSDSVGSSSEAYTQGGPAWYRKELEIPREWEGRKISVEFDGAYHDATVYLNGKQIGAHAYGYTSFAIDLTSHVHFGSTNLLAVRVDTSGNKSRWYSGSGLYRHVWLTVAPTLRFAQWGIAITTPRVETDAAAVLVNARILNDASSPRSDSLLRLTVLDGDGQAVANLDRLIRHGDEQLMEVSLTVAKPKVWSPENPYLYTLRSEIVSNDGVIDAVETTFGIRSISFDVKNGFLLNGVPTLMRGGCVHHDNGPLGAAAYDRAEERRVELLKDAGFNAIRCAHNPPTTEFLDACDRLGMLVIDESFDHWTVAKTPMDYARFYEANWETDMRSMIERDRNHPSIVMWSIGNEIPEQMTPTGATEAKKLADFTRALDPSRPVTAAYSGQYGPGRDEFMAELDVVGYNYRRADYVKDHEDFPNRVIVASETFPNQAYEYWAAVEEHPYVVGDFVWTSFDYLGEAGIGRVKYPTDPDTFCGVFPWTVAYCGDIDIIGVRRPQSYYRGIVWNVGPKVVAFVDARIEGEPEYVMTDWGWPDEIASWTWPGSENKPRTVRVYARTPKVRLTLNGKSLGEKETTPSTKYTATYSVPYEAGELIAIGLDADGEEVDRWVLKTAGAPARLRLTPDHTTLVANGEDLSYVAVELLDEDGNLCVNSAVKVSFALSGPGKLLAVGSGKPTNIESFLDTEHTTFEGRLLAIVKSSDSAGTISISATADGIPSTSVDVASI